MKTSIYLLIAFILVLAGTLVFGNFIMAKEYEAGHFDKPEMNRVPVKEIIEAAPGFHHISVDGTFNIYKKDLVTGEDKKVETWGNTRALNVFVIIAPNDTQRIVRNNYSKGCVSYNIKNDTLFVDLKIPEPLKYDYNGFNSASTIIYVNELESISSNKADLHLLNQSGQDDYPRSVSVSLNNQAYAFMSHYFVDTLRLDVSNNSSAQIDTSCNIKTLFSNVNGGEMIVPTKYWSQIKDKESIMLKYNK
ncbi:hypothetical protein COR50_01835 [Chitinophaga caeni]|uniref:Uncharacterized protein n=1 Tax=Chitinophaga caeni TaxID=2029983 RepID=A0A291QQ51_9BACT|nr:hypothetical protein [Chitinophaga caeni]ATL46002.1 hypothetical protein COR50_01835 [Chitinophaga caeni]